jgi:hypothetical protein
VIIILMAIGGYSIVSHWWLFSLVAIDGFFFNVY